MSYTAPLCTRCKVYQVRDANAGELCWPCINDDRLAAIAALEDLLAALAAETRGGNRHMTDAQKAAYDEGARILERRGGERG